MCARHGNYLGGGSPLNVLYETNGKNEIVRSYVYSESGQLLAMRKGSNKFFYHYNAHGDVIALTNQNGEVVASYEYDAWGNPIKTDQDNPYRYAGYQYDTETGMYYLIARYYHPTHGVFLSLDPDPGDDDDILTQNGYTYANNNPVMMVDPDGHWFWLVVNAGFAAYDGYKAYKSGASWKGVAWAAGSNFLKVGYVKKASKVVKASNGGRLGNSATRNQNKKIADTLISRGWKITGGGGYAKEEYLPGPNNSRKGSNFVDITAKKRGELLESIQLILELMVK